MPPVDTYELLIQNIVDFAIYMLDREGRVASWNAGTERIKGYTADEIIGQHFSRFYMPEDVEARLPWRALEIARTEGHYQAGGSGITGSLELLRKRIAQGRIGDLDRYITTAQGAAARAGARANTS